MNWFYGTIGIMLLRFAFAFSMLFLASLELYGEDLADRSGGPNPQTAQGIMESARDSIVVIKQSGRESGHKGIGTGFVISRDGLIATSLHVIGEARPLSVSLADGETLPVTEVYAWDRKLDLAVIRVSKKDLLPLRLGNSDNLKQGATVVAIGNPQGLARSIVQGVVSAIRDLDFGPMIQLAIPIEPGNSGGPLLDMKGRVQGIVDMKSAVTENLGFATPINALKTLLDHPNTVSLEKWLFIGKLNETLWTPLMGGEWRQKAGMILIDGPGGGFGGRSLCLSKTELPELPYEIGVTVYLEDETGAAGLAFGSDGADRHYGFYPSAGQIRLTRFDGPTVFNWNILRQIDTPFYRPGEWNRLKVRVEAERILCFVNGRQVAEVPERVASGGGAGLANFRNTSSRFRNFQIGRSIEPVNSLQDQVNLRAQLERTLAERKEAVPIPELLVQESTRSRTLLLDMAREWEQRAGEARRFASELNARHLAAELAQTFRLPENQISLFSAAFLIARVEAPELEIKPYLQEIETMAGYVQQSWASNPTKVTAREKLDQLRRYLFVESGFHGSRSDYYNRANSFMNQVIEDREGIPITLSVLFLELAARLGIDGVEGMPFPGHFMVRFSEAARDPVYVDVYDGGKLYSKAELYSLVSHHSEVPLLDEHFRAATKKEIVVRMLKNLVSVANDPARSLPYLDLLVALAPDEPLERWRRASLRLQAGDRAKAREDLQWLLEKKPAGFEWERVEELYRSLR